ncbi:energy transducer TonB [Erythrobacter sp. KY5]|uniref:energy transducer TonB n=1 Tax=Erythrobacter sp. KY5 TaxID=2011159 RepID=UPI000DBEF4E1|nr:energy transducer TonB [Erythrobacter sp. KY5]AWW75655.1 energy transducer TonB [Erythrobacter sp. KY5]
MGESTFRTEDRIGLIAAIVLHGALVALLAAQVLFAPEPFTPPQRVAVSLATEVSLESTAPNPVPESRAAIAPTLTDIPSPPEEASSQPAAETAPPTPPRPQTRTQPRTQAPPDTRDRRRPEETRQQPSQRRAEQPAGGSRIGDNFLEGQGSSTQTDTTSAPAATFGRAERAALASAITRQLRPHWNAPSGVEAELLESVVTWQLNEDGSLKGRPRCTNVSRSVTDSNRPQAGLHCERAIRAVQLAAPFNLPEQFYSRWKDLEWEFNRRL